MAPTLVQPSSSLSSTSSLSFWHTHIVLGLELWKYLVIAFACFIAVLLAGCILWIRPFTRKAKVDRESVQVQDVVSSANSSPTMKKGSPVSSQKLRLLSPKTWKSYSSSSPPSSPSPSSSFGCKDALAMTRFHHTYPSPVYDPLRSSSGLVSFTLNSFQTNTNLSHGASSLEASNSSVSHLLPYSADETSFSRGEFDVTHTRPSLLSRPSFDYFGIPILPSPSEIPDDAGYSLWNNSKLSPVCGSVVSMSSSVNYAPILSLPPSDNFCGFGSPASGSAISVSIPSPARCYFQEPSLPSGVVSHPVASFGYVQNKPLPRTPKPESPHYHYF